MLLSKIAHFVAGWAGFRDNYLDFSLGKKNEEKKVHARPAPGDHDSLLVDTYSLYFSSFNRDPDWTYRLARTILGTRYDVRRVNSREFRRSNTFLERSEFLIDTSQKKSLRVCRVHACTRVRLLLVLVLGRQIVYGQNTVYLCLSKYIVFENTQL